MLLNKLIILVHALVHANIANLISCTEHELHVLYTNTQLQTSTTLYST